MAGPGVNANSRDPQRDALLLAAVAERLGVFVQRQRASDRAGGMVRLLAGGSEQHVQGIADDLGDRAVMGKHDIGHAGEVFVEQRPEHARLQRLHQRGEAGNVGEQRRDLAALAAEIDRVGVAGQPLGQVRREVARQRGIGPFGLACRRRASRRNSICRSVLAMVVSRSRKSIGLVTKSNAPRFMAVRILAMSP